MPNAISFCDAQWGVRKGEVDVVAECLNDVRAYLKKRGALK